MSLSKDRLIFDATAIGESDQTGAHLLGTGNAKVTSSTVGAKIALDVAIASISLLSERAEDSAAVSGDIGVSVLGVRQDVLATSTDATGDYSSFKVNALGEMYVHDADTKAQLITLNGAVSTSAHQVTQTGILTTANASLTAIKGKTDQFTFDAGRLVVLADVRLESDVADDAPDTENPLKMGSRAVSGALAAISATGDKANVISDMYRRLYVTTAPNVGFKTSAANVGTIASQLVAVPLAGRGRIMIQNLGNAAVYIGFNNTVAVVNGLKISAGAFLEMPFGSDLAIWVIATSGTQDVRIVEIA